jgi:hypothetical protein
LPEADPDVSGPALAAAHGAVLEVATLCGGRAPSQAELAYIERRADAIAALADSLAPPGPEASGGGGRPGVDAERPAAVVEARDELDLITGTSSVDRLQALAGEAGHRHGDR